MASGADQFLSSFNRIEKRLRDELDNPRNMGFSEMVRRLSKSKNINVRRAEDDLLQMAQLRNAIVHEKIGENFVIAEPNEWVVNRIQEIEHSLLAPEKVMPRFAKRVTGFEKHLPLPELLKIVAQKRYSQFPIYDNGRFLGLITLRMLGYWLAKESLHGEIKLAGRTADELLAGDGKRSNYCFVSAETTIVEVEELFQKNALLEAVLITKDKNPNGNLLGIIRPRDIFKEERVENL
ncbi:CBS domain-containing protein [Enterococcus casseliflavus]|uniref:CBS domain-containing protein n=1 Tax=Enterococcus casseliflavus TaxID=37734 RepID=UPI003DA6A45B